MSAVTKGNVYVVRQGENGPVKIGVSTNLSGRIGALQMGSAYELAVLAVSFGGGYELETELHRKYRPWRLMGEWYSGEILPHVVEDVNNYRWYERIIKNVYYDSLPGDEKEMVDSFRDCLAWVGNKAEA